MRMDKLTSKLQVALSDAQSLAVGKDHNYIEPAHLVSVLVDQKGGSIRPLLMQTGFDIPALRNGYARVFLQDRSGRDLTESREVTDTAREDLGQWVVQLGVLALLISFPWAVFWGYIVPASIARTVSLQRTGLCSCSLRATRMPSGLEWV